MNKVVFVNKMNRTFNKICFGVKKHSPEILVVSGIGGVVVSTVLACKATLKVDEIIAGHKQTLGKINDMASCDRNSEDIYTQKDYKRDVTITYVKTGAKIARLYAPAVSVGVLSITSILASNNILRKRNVALAAAYATIDKSFKEYRNRVVERFGEEVDKELRYNAKTTKIEEVVVDENGKEKKVKTTGKVVDIDEASDYARYFDNKCSGWEPNLDYCLMFLRAQQAYANDKLKAKDRLFLNDVYKMLGIKDSKPGQVVGWDMNNPNGDHFVDFGIQEVYRKVLDEKTGGEHLEKVILLDFNCDGNIWNLMEE